MIKLVYVYTSIAIKGGVERVLVEKVNLLAKDNNYDVTLLTYNQGDHPLAFPIDDKVHYKDLKVRTHIKYRHNGVRRWWYNIRLHRLLSKRLHQALDEIRPDIIITTTSDQISLLTRLKGKAAFVVESHGGYDHIIDYPNESLVHRWDLYRRKALLHKADVIVTLTRADAERWSQHYSQVKVIQNVLKLSPVTSQLNTKNIVFVGRFVKQKGIEEMFAVWDLVHKRHSDWTLLMYGEEHEKYCNRQIPGIIMNGPTDKIFDVYRDSSMLLLTSLWEPFGLVVGEAMSCGLPVVAMECDGPSDIITDGVDGFLVKDRDIEAFADRVCQLIEEVELRRRMGQEAVKKVQRYSADAIMPMWKQLFETLNRSRQ